MYDLYKDRVTIIIPVVLVGGGAVALLCGGIYDLWLREFSFNTIMFAIFSAFIFFIAYALFLAGKSNPYEWIEETKKNDPKRVEDMENDFEHAIQLTYNIWKGDLNYYFKGPNFFAIPIGQIRNIVISKEYRRRVGSYLRCIISSDEGEIDFNILSIIVTSDEAMIIMNQMAAESGIEASVKV